MPIKILPRAICRTWVFWETTTRKGKLPRSSTTSVEKMVAMRLLIPGCRGTAPEPAARIRLCPGFHQARELFLVCVCWCLGVPETQLGLCLWVTSSACVSLGAMRGFSRTALLTAWRFWDGSCLFSCFRQGWMWEKWIFQPGQIMKILFLL